MFNEMVRRNLKSHDATNGVIAHSLKKKKLFKVHLKADV